MVVIAVFSKLSATGPQGIPRGLTTRISFGGHVVVVACSQTGPQRLCAGIRLLGESVFLYLKSQYSQLIPQNTNILALHHQLC